MRRAFALVALEVPDDASADDVRAIVRQWLPSVDETAHNPEVIGVDWLWNIGSTVATPLVPPPDDPPSTKRHGEGKR